MVSESIEIPNPTALSTEMKQVAIATLKSGPPSLREDDLKRWRYQITDLVDDIRTPRLSEELTASGAQLYGLLADFYFRSQNLWSATGKTIPRKLHQHSPAFAARFIEAFEALFIEGDSQSVVALTEVVLREFGGSLFGGYRLNAPTNFRLDKAE